MMKDKSNKERAWRKHDAREEEKERIMKECVDAIERRAKNRRDGD